MVATLYQTGQPGKYVLLSLPYKQLRNITWKIYFVREVGAIEMQIYVTWESSNIHFF